jgi:signal transduction histidine kinase/ligand-binding sensor domain-containing protein
MYRFLYCILSICLLWPAPSAAQPQLPTPRFETLGVDDGLSQSSVYALYQDKKGFIWIGTGDGLNRFDGSELKAFKVPSAAGTAPSSYVGGALCEDDSGNIWFANERGLHCWHASLQKILTHYHFSWQWVNGRRFTAVCLLAGRQLWSFSPGVGFLLFDIKNGACTFHKLPASYLRPTNQLVPVHPTVDEQGRIWFKMYNEGKLNCFDTRLIQYQTPLPGDNYRRIFFGKGKHYILAAAAFDIYDSASRTTRIVPLNSLNGYRLGTYALKEDRWGRVWISTSGEGLFCYDPSRNALVNYSHSNVKLRSLPIDLLTTLYIDRSDNLWVGTDGGGVSRLDLKPPRFKLFPLNEGDYPVLKDYFTKCFYEDHDGNLWFGTHTNGFGILNLQTGDLKQYSHVEGKDLGLPNNIVGVLHEDPEGHVWVGHSLGFSVFDKKGGSFQPVPITPAPPYNKWNVYGTGMCNLYDGRLLATTSSGIVLFSKHNGMWTGRSFLTSQYLGTHSTSVCQTPDGSIWISTYNNGLFRFLLNADSFQFINRYFPGLNVRGLHPDGLDDSALWVCSSNGLFCLHTGSGAYRVFGEADGLRNAYVYGVLEDSAHNLWMSTNGGLSMYDRRKKLFLNYTYADGLQSNEFNSGAYHKGRTGTLYFGGIRGFNWFYPGEVETVGTLSPPGAALLGIEVNEQARIENDARLQSDGLRLKYNENNLAFTFAALDFTRPEANRVAYFLDGWDRDWITTTAHSAHYSNLSPGSYRLRLKARNSEGVWSLEKSWLVVIAAPFWQTPLFYLSLATLLVCIVIGIVVLIIRRRVAAKMRMYERQRVLMDERTRISKDMHDEIGSGLTRIAMMSEGLRLHGKALGQGDPQKISLAARGLVQNMSEIIWALNPSQDTLDSLLAYMREQINAFVEPFELACLFSFPSEVPATTLTNVQRRNIYLTAKEAVNNALKHSGATALSIAAHLSNNTMHIEVRDNGRGFKCGEVRNTANGLRNMRRRIEEIGGTFECASDKMGTVVLFSFSFTQSDHLIQNAATTIFTLHRARHTKYF